MRKKTRLYRCCELITERTLTLSFSDLGRRDCENVTWYLGNILTRKMWITLTYSILYYEVPGTVSYNSVKYLLSEIGHLRFGL